jgi:hypothetical protein
MTPEVFQQQVIIGPIAVISPIGHLYDYPSGSIKSDLSFRNTGWQVAFHEPSLHVIDPPVKVRIGCWKDARDGPEKNIPPFIWRQVSRRFKLDTGFLHKMVFAK